jgi:hypothetical protein
LTRFIFSTGTARGGTNLITKIISVSESAHLASDPYLALLKYLRMDFLNQHTKTDITPNDPLPDYYYEENKLPLLDLMMKGGGAPLFDLANLTNLIDQIKIRASVSTPLLIPYLNQLSGSNYQELISSAILCIGKAFNKVNPSCLGFNENWAIELFPLLADMFPQSKFIIVIRDPRASISSALKQKDKTKMIQVSSFVRGWRKNVALMKFYQLDPRFKDRLYICNYEKFVENSTTLIKDLCSFVEVKFSDKMLDSKNYLDGSGNQWKGNSYAHEKAPSGIYKDSINIWEQQLSQEIAESIEFLAYPELKSLGYKPLHYHNFPSNQVCQFLQKDFLTHSSWKNTKGTASEEIKHEVFRNFMIDSKNATFPDIDIRRYFLFKNVFEELKGNE